MLSSLLPVFLSGVLLCASGEENGRTILDTASFWRCRYALGTDVAVKKDGTQVPVHPAKPRDRNYEKVDGKRKTVYTLHAHPASRIWAVPPSDWMSSDFDDSNWPRLRGQFLIGKYKTPQHGYRSVPVFCLRGKFHIDDPQSVRDPFLSVGYHGGIAVYVNGKEIARQHLPKGELKPDTLADPYPEEAFFDSKGCLFHNGKYTNKEDHVRMAEAEKVRLREIKGLTIPSSVLRKGINVLAVELHRSPAPENMFLRMPRRMKNINFAIAAWWPRVAVSYIKLTAAGGVRGDNGHRPAGIQVWTSPVYQEIGPDAYGDPCDSPGLIQLCTGRNGVVSGQAVISSGTGFGGLKIETSDLKGPGKIPASEIQVRYGLMGWYRGRYLPRAFMILEDSPPARVEVYKERRAPKGSGAVQPVWITVRVTEDAKPGVYSGNVTIGASGLEPVKVPVKLKAVNWDVPDPKEFMSFLELIQSPESVAMQYGVEMWSEKHWELIERAFKLLGDAGNDMVWVTAQRHTHFGNEHAMIRFRKKGDTYEPDLSIADKYLALAKKHLGRIRVVSLYCYRCPWGPGMHYGHHKGKDLPVLISLNNSGNKLEEAEGPEWGTPECAALWKPVFGGMKELCKKHGIPEANLMIGATGDVPPTDTALDTLKQASGGLMWVFESHISRNTLGTKKDHRVGYAARAWGGDGRHQDPDFGPGYGWKNDLKPWRTVTRGHFDDHALPRLRWRLEAMVTNVVHYGRLGKGHRDKRDYGTHGIGRLGADFWNVLGDKHGRKHVLCGRYSETAWGQLKVSYCAQHFLMPGRKGPVATAQLEMFRESSQEIEARVFIEKALAAPEQKARLGKELADRAQQLLDNRTRCVNLSPGNDWRSILALGVQERSEELYELAAEVNSALK